MLRICLREAARISGVYPRMVPQQRCNWGRVVTTCCASIWVDCEAACTSACGRALREQLSAALSTRGPRHRAVAGGWLSPQVILTTGV
jgi:hypothetical protein